jgi:two-component system, LuxR family, response regulator FixJ
MSNHEIFIVDDDADMCSSLSELFTGEGYQVSTFADGSSFLAAARERSPACVLLDVWMPGRSGLDLLKEINAGSYPAPVVMMSGRGDIAMAVEAMRDGACDFLEKCVGADAIVQRVRETIDRPAQQRLRRSNDSPALSPSFPGFDRLTPREHEVLGLIAGAASSKEAARSLGISPRTVENHRVQIMLKVGAKNAVDLIRIVLGDERLARGSGR